MHSATLESLPCLIRTPTNLAIPNHKRWIQRNENERRSSSIKHVRTSGSKFVSSSSSSSSSSVIPNSQIPNYRLSCSSETANKLRFLVSEFKALSAPIDRVKRLLHYAALLPPFDESDRVEANRVRACTTQVWVETRMDSEGLMRFRADSDSEISKGFCSCLTWVLDRAAPEEVLAVKAEDLADMNVGLYGGAHSRVNTWHSVLTSMQKRTKGLVEERKRVAPSEAFSALAEVGGSRSEQPRILKR
ncbi:quinolinate synthase [Sarracenia purpurea var. burkii]